MPAYHPTEIETKTEVNQVKHRDYQCFDRIKHEVALVKNSNLDNWYNFYKKNIRRNNFEFIDQKISKIIIVNSVHHQGIKVLGAKLKAEAFSYPDGLIEAYSVSEDNKNSSKNSKYPFIMGIQWHPEYSHTIKKQVIDPFPILKQFCLKCLNNKLT
ncbi:MAG: gamma-glutamyl-gamma-aminobutyrate hydrolase family protein [Oligoflexia bacterium]|nr:gamma-glutamyl-gamma-aminobutyrate hydrolase family protein [Oligoflexia bacterium]